MRSRICKKQNLQDLSLAKILQSASLTVLEMIRQQNQKAFQTVKKVKAAQMA
jgi:hypothetical protein